MSIRINSACLFASAVFSLTAAQIDPEFGIELFDGTTGTVRIASSEMESSAVTRENGSVRIAWKGHPRLGPDFAAVAAGVETGDAVEWTFSCSGNVSGMPIGKIAFPVVDVPCTDKASVLYSPDAGGGTMGWKRKIDLKKRTAGKEFVSTLSPGFRFVSVLNGENSDSWYLDVRDAVSNAGRFTLAKKSDSTARLQWIHDVPLAPSNSVAYRLPFTARVRAFRGDWFEAAAYYREWVKTTPRYAAAKSRDKSRVRDIGLWMWNRGLAETVIPPVERFQSDTGLKVALDWYWWFKEMPGTFYPSYWPPREGAEKFKADVQRLKRMGVFTQVYLNGMTWDENAPSWKDGGLESVAMLRDGSYFSCAYNRFNPNHRLANLCGEAPKFQARIRREIAHLVDAGFDSIYLDMIGCNAYGPCFNPAHRHIPGGGTHMTDGFRDYLGRIKRDFPGILLSTEDSGEAYVDIFDSHISTHSSYERHGWIGTAPDVEFVPVFQAVYHGCVAVFGNYAIVDNVPYWDPRWPMKPWWTGHEEHLRRDYPDQFAVEFSRGPVWGLQPSVHNFWLHHATNAAVAAEYRFICDTAGFYRDNREFLFDGEMCPPGRLECMRKKVDFVKVSVFAEKVASHSSMLPVVFHNVWRSPEGRVAAILVNWTREPQRWKLSAPDVSGEGILPPRSWKRVDARVEGLGLRKGDRVVILGDSLTNQGLAVRDGGYFHRLTNAIARVHGEGHASIVPLGFSGWHVPSWIETERTTRTKGFRYDTCGKFWDVKDVFDAGADVAVVFLGMNDILRPVVTSDPASHDQWVEDYRRFIATLRARLKPRRVLLCTISPLTGDPQARKNEIRRALNGRIRALAREETCGVVEIDRLLDPLNDEARRLWKSHLSGDFVHPSWGLGHAAIARAMAEAFGEWDAEKMLADDVRREAEKVLARADAFSVNQTALVSSLKPEAKEFDYEVSWYLKAEHGRADVAIEVPDGWRVIATNTVSVVPHAFEPRYFDGTRGYFTVRGAPGKAATAIGLSARMENGKVFRKSLAIPAPWRARNNGGEWRMLSPSWDYIGWGNAAAVDPFQSFFGSTNETLTVFRRIHVPTARKAEVRLSTRTFSARLKMAVRVNGEAVGSRTVRAGKKYSVAEPIPVELKAGWNTLEVDCRHDRSQRQFLCSLTLPGGKAMEDALYGW